MVGFKFKNFLQEHIMLEFNEEEIENTDNDIGENDKDITSPFSVNDIKVTRFDYCSTNQPVVDSLGCLSPFFLND
jgi:hypothetical protein